MQHSTQPLLFPAGDERCASGPYQQRTNGRDEVHARNPYWGPAEMADAAEVQNAMAEQQDMQRLKDKLRSLLEQRMAPEDAAECEPSLDSLVRAGYVTAETIKDSGRQVLED